MRREVGSVKACRDQGGNGQNDGIPDFTRSSLLYSYNQSRKKRLLSCFTYSPEPGETALFQLGETPVLVFTERTRESVIDRERGPRVIFSGGCSPPFAD